MGRSADEVGAVERVAVDLRAELHAVVHGEARRLGVDLAQYLCEAALARAIAGLMLGTETRFERLAVAVREAMADHATRESVHEAELILTVMTRLEAAERHAEAQAVVAQSEQAIRQAKELLRRCNGHGGPEAAAESA